MKIFTKITTILLTFILLLSLIIVPTSAASSATLYFNKSSVKVGDKVTVSVSIKPNESMYAVEFYLQYNDSVLKYKSGNGNKNAAGVLKVVESPSGDKSVKYNFTFEALKKGTSKIAVTDCIYVTNGSGGSSEKSFVGASASISVKDANLSSNAKLKSLNVSGFTLSPKFSSNTTSYNVKVPFDTKKVSVTANTSDKNAKVVSVEGNNNLKVGKNVVTVTVEAENGTQKKYTINVERLKEGAEDTSSEESEELVEEGALKTNISGTDYSILTKIPETLLLEGFSIETKNVNGYDIETAVDKDGVFRIFYLKSNVDDTPVPYLYDEVLDQFDKLKYITVGERYYIFTEIPSDAVIPENLYSSSFELAGFTVNCLADSNSSMSDFRYVYCYSNGNFSYYRFDTLESTIHRFPEFETLGNQKQDSDTLFARFSRLSTNGKVIIVALFVLILGVFALLIMLIVYLFKRALNRNADIILSDDYDDFDEITVENENNVLK
ncbi:MAG: hypothetical protein E7537_01875 [Ruminococcaceae bacterium]|nr:hypothetical protein [Oscillospiraceae bacterium]